MKYVIWLLTALVCLALIGLPIPFPGDDGAYNVFSRLYWCRTPRACIHERGHALDQALGWPSRSEEYLYAVQVYMVAEIRGGTPSPTAHLIMTHWCSSYRPWVDPNAELYADVYMAADGQVEQIPASLRPFYGVQR